MTFILRWLAILILLPFGVVCLGAAIAVGLVAFNAPVDLSAYLSEQQLASLAEVGWLEALLWLGAGLYFMGTIIQLIAKHRVILAWVIGTALYAGRWVVFEQQSGRDALQSVQGVDVASYAAPEALVAAPERTEVQLALFGLLLLAGVFVFIVHFADAAYWRKRRGEQEG